MSIELKGEAKISGKNCIIAGGTKNMGGGTAEELAKLGCNLFLHYHSDKDKANAEALKEKLSKTAKVELWQGALDNEKDVAAFFDAGEKFLGSLDICLNFVGKVLKKPLAEFTPEEFEAMDTVNNKIAFFFLQESAKRINQNGKIVTLVTSLLAAYTPLYSLYQGTKAPVEFYSKGLSKELVPKGVSVNCVAPGPVDTSFFYSGGEQEQDVEYYKTVTIRQRLTYIEDIVPIVRFLVTEGYWITGQTIFCSGGFTAH